MKVVDLDKLKGFFLSLPNYTLSVMDVLKLIENQIPTINGDLVDKKDVIDLIQNYYFAPFATVESYEERELLLDNICTAIRFMPQKDGDKNGS